MRSLQSSSGAAIVDADATAERSGLRFRPDSVEGLRAALQASAADVGAALATARSGSSFYEADHPVVAQQRRDLEAAVRVWQVNAGGDTLIAAAGESLLITGLDVGVANDAARSLCATMISKSLVGFRIKAPAVARDLGELVVVLAEHPRRVRSAGGVTRILAERGVRSIEVTEMDLDKLLTGAPIDPTGLDPLFVQALTETLALKRRDERKGAAVSLTLERVDDPKSLGSLLDELIDGAAPGVADAADPGARNGADKAKTQKRTGPLAGVSADDLAELCGQAFGKVTAQQQSPEALTEAARVLSGALVRLSPMARFKLLQKIAGTGDQAAAEAVGREVQNPLLMSALAQVVMGGERDSKLATAIGSLLERMRPLERDRQSLIDQLDDTARAQGRPLDALFLQELNESSQKTTFGALDLPFRETREGLARAATLRLNTRGQPDIVARTFATLRPENGVQRTARLLVGMLEQERTVAPATLASVRTILTLTVIDPALASANGAMIHALWTRALRDGPTSPAAKQLADLATSQNGAEWSIALLEQLRTLRGADTAALLAEFLRGVLAVHEGESFRRRLVDALHFLDRGVLRVVERRVAEFSPAGVNTLIARAGRDSPIAALGLAQTALRGALPGAIGVTTAGIGTAGGAPAGASSAVFGARGPGSPIEVKEAALRALTPFPDDAVLAFLRRATGLEGELLAVQALYAQKETPAGVLRLQRAAIETLGATRAVGAVNILVELLTRSKLVGGGEFDKVRGFAARALSVNNTREARLALDDGKRSKNRAVRLACGSNA